MKISIAGTSGAEHSADDMTLRSLADTLTSRGHTVTAVPIPTLGGDLEQQLDAYAHCLGLDLGDSDLLITATSPAWLIDHDCHVVYSSGDSLSNTTEEPLPPALEHCSDPADLIATARTLSKEPGKGPTADGLRQRLEHIVFTSDRLRCLATPSEHAARRFETIGWNQAIMVAPPVATMASTDGTVPPRLVCFTESRFDGSDRLTLALGAFASIDDIHAELRIAGDGPQRAMIEAGTHDRRIRFLGAVSEEQRPIELRQASCVAVLSIDEGWSHLGVEAMRAGAPLVVATDAGGITEIVEHGVNGVLVAPSADQLSWGIRHIASSPRLRWQLGLQARRRAAELSWLPFIDVIDDLLSPATRPKALTLSTYPIDPMVGGGQRRARFLNRALADRCDVTVLVNTSPTPQIRRRTIEAGLTQVEVPKSERQRAAELDMFHAMDKMPVDDLTASKLADASPAFKRELDDQLGTADFIVATQPFLVPCLPETSLPIVHDSQNVESSLKADLLPDTPGGRWLLDAATTSEAEAGRRAALVTACTDSDLLVLAQQAPSTVSSGLVVGNGVDSAALAFKTEAEHQQARAELLTLAGQPTNDQRPIGLFIGSWHPPNIGAARLILGLAAERPDWLFVLAGSHTSEFAGESLPENVHLIAIFAESLLWPLLAGADVALNPMNSGGGSNLKLFDYLSVGTAIATTAIGARGLPGPERYATIAEPSVAAFSEAIDLANNRQHTADGRAMRIAGRAVVEEAFDWRILGEQWSTGILEALGLTADSIRHRTAHQHHPVVSAMDPPSLDPIIATMQLLGQQAQTTAPSAQEVSMDPALRERLKQANDNRNIGRDLPAGARFTAPKKALIRVGHALTNEQVIYNKAMVEAVEQLAVSLRSLETEQRELHQSIETLSAENRALRRRLEVLE